MNQTKLCECGCGTTISYYTKKGGERRFVKGHHMRSDENRAKISRALQGAERTPDHRAKLAAASQRHWDSLLPDQQELIREQGRLGIKKVDMSKRIKAVKEARTGVPRPQHVREKIGRSQLGRTADTNTRQRQSESKKRYFRNNPAARVYLRQKRLEQPTINRDTTIEIALQEALREHGIVFEIHVPVLDICIPDILIRDAEMIIQADGDYWHRLTEVEERDRHQDELLAKHGYTVLRFWESDIRKNLDECVDRIVTTLEQISCQQ